MSGDHLRVERDGMVAMVTIDRPTRRNALDEPLWRALRDTARGLADDPPRVVILTGAGGHFSSGMDLMPDNPLVQRLAPAIQEGDRDALREVIGGLKACVDAIAALPCPVIAAIEGACFGGGLEVALTADLRVAGESARFAMPETRWGLVPDVGGTVRLARLIGRSRAADLILTGREANASEALALGLLNRVVPDGGALEAARTLSDGISRGAPVATRAVLDILRQVDGLTDAAAFAAETEAGVATLANGEAMEGLTAFSDRRPPRWAP